MNMQWKNDQQRQEHEVTSVEASGDGWEVGAGGWCIGVPSAHCAEPPKRGEKILLFGKGLGYPVRGIVIGERTYRYKTEDEWNAARIAQKASDDAAALQKAVDERPERDRRIAALPAPLQDRLRRFLRVNDSFAASHEPYELFVCEQAALIASALPEADDVREFSMEKIDAQKRLVPSLDYAEHSGNTFGAACLIAQILVSRPDLVAHAHGALCPLVGCEEYGCWAARESKDGDQQQRLD